MSPTHFSGLPRAQGFTLLELLVALGLIGIVMTAVLTLNIRTGSATSALQARADLTSETQIAQNYIAAKLRSAAYIYPYESTAGTVFIQMTSSGYSAYNPNAAPNVRAVFNGTGNYNWRYGNGDANDPIIAFIMPPTGSVNNPAAPDYIQPGTNACATASASTKSQKCYAFYAYYAVPRSLLVVGGGSGAGTVPTGANQLAADTLNDNAVWALMEYRAYFSSTGYSTARSNIPMSGTGRLVLDYVKPTTQTGLDKLFVGGVSTNVTAPITSVTVNLATTRRVGGQTVNVPGTGRYSLKVYSQEIPNQWPSTGPVQINN